MGTKDNNASVLRGMGVDCRNYFETCEITVLVPMSLSGIAHIGVYSEFRADCSRFGVQYIEFGFGGGYFDVGARFVLRPGSWDTVNIGILLPVESDFMVSVPLLYNASSVDKNNRSLPNSWTILNGATKSSGSVSSEG
jgi:hypothetical protein